MDSLKQVVFCSVFYWSLETRIWDETRYALFWRGGGMSLKIGFCSIFCQSLV